MARVDRDPVIVDRRLQHDLDAAIRADLRSACDTDRRSRSARRTRTGPPFHVQRTASAGGTGSPSSCGSEQVEDRRRRACGTAGAGSTTATHQARRTGPRRMTISAPLLDRLGKLGEAWGPAGFRPSSAHSRSVRPTLVEWAGSAVRPPADDHVGHAREADRVSLLEPRDRRSRPAIFLAEVDLGRAGRAEVHRAAGVEHQAAAQIRIGLELLGRARSNTPVGPPVEPAEVIPRNIFAILGELDRRPAMQAGMPPRDAPCIASARTAETPIAGTARAIPGNSESFGPRTSPSGRASPYRMRLQRIKSSLPFPRSAWECCLRTLCVAHLAEDSGPATDPVVGSCCAVPWSCARGAMSRGRDAERRRRRFPTQSVGTRVSSQ